MAAGVTTLLNKISWRPYNEHIVDHWAKGQYKSQWYGPAEYQYGVPCQDDAYVIPGEFSAASCVADSSSADNLLRDSNAE